MWQVINQTLGKQRHQGSIILYISTEGVRSYDPQCISNAFGSFYANLGSTLANKITSSKRSVDYYINNILRSLNSLVLLPTTGTEVSQIIQRLPNKNSRSHDQINNTLLKKLCEAISHPLSIIFNQSISSGVFQTL